MSDARSAVLQRIRAALGDVPADEAPAWEGPAAPAGEGDRATAPAASLEDRFAERVAAYRATVTRCTDVAAAVAEACARHGATRLAVPADLDGAWLPDGVTAVRDAPALDVAALDAVDGVLTGCALGIAETGTIVLDGGAVSGRRALTLVPDLHVCVVRERDLVAGVPDAIAALAPAVAAGRPITFISGPSATSDIELDRVEGVHGPRRLEVVVVASR